MCELAIGTGRIAMPLAATGLDVCGIDQSAAMLDQLRARPGGDRIRVVRGDMTTEAPDGRFGLVYLGYNTIGNVLTQQGQVSVLPQRRLPARPTTASSSSRARRRGGPWPTRQFVDAEHVANDEVVLDVNTFDPATQLLAENHVTITADGIRLGPIAQRLTTPAELDLMAELAGLTLVERWGGWSGEPFTGDSAVT